jgi:hypothetical protein
VTAIDKGDTLMTTYGQIIEWNCGHRLEVGGFPTHKEAFETAIRLAKESGWTAPKWWQFWRWNEVVRSDICR